MEDDEIEKFWGSYFNIPPGSNNDPIPLGSESHSSSVVSDHSSQTPVEENYQVEEVKIRGGSLYKCTSCPREAVYGKIKTTAKRCYMHRTASDVDTRYSYCMYDECTKTADYGSEGVLKYCIDHNDGEPLAHNIMCGEFNCYNNATHGMKYGLRKYCEQHASAHCGTIEHGKLYCIITSCTNIIHDVKKKQILCHEHKKEEVKYLTGIFSQVVKQEVVTSMCVSCGKIALFGLVGSRSRIYCTSCVILADPQLTLYEIITDTLCSINGCNRYARITPIHGIGAYCIFHASCWKKTEQFRMCIDPDCDEPATYVQLYGVYTYCYEHARYYNLLPLTMTVRCVMCGKLAKYGRDHIRLFCDDHNYKNYPYLSCTWCHRLPIYGSNGRHTLCGRHKNREETGLKKEKKIKCSHCNREAIAVTRGEPGKEDMAYCTSHLDCDVESFTKKIQFNLLNPPRCMACRKYARFGINGKHQRCIDHKMSSDSRSAEIRKCKKCFKYLCTKHEQ